MITAPAFGERPLCLPHQLGPHIGADIAAAAARSCASGRLLPLCRSGPVGLCSLRRAGRRIPRRLWPHVGRHQAVTLSLGGSKCPVLHSHAAPQKRLLARLRPSVRVSRCRLARVLLPPALLGLLCLLGAQELHRSSHCDSPPHRAPGSGRLRLRSRHRARQLLRVDLLGVAVALLRRGGGCSACSRARRARPRSALRLRLRPGPLRVRSVRARPRPLCVLRRRALPERPLLGRRRRLRRSIPLLLLLPLRRRRGRVPRRREPHAAVRALRLGLEALRDARLWGVRDQLTQGVGLLLDHDRWRRGAKDAPRAESSGRRGRGLRPSACPS